MIVFSFIFTHFLSCHAEILLVLPYMYVFIWIALPNTRSWLLIAAFRKLELSLSNSWAWFFIIHISHNLLSQFIFHHWWIYPLVYFFYFLDLFLPSSFSVSFVLVLLFFVLASNLFQLSWRTTEKRKIRRRVRPLEKE